MQSVVIPYDITTLNTQTHHHTLSNLNTQTHKDIATHRNTTLSHGCIQQDEDSEYTHHGKVEVEHNRISKQIHPSVIVSPCCESLSLLFERECVCAMSCVIAIHMHVIICTSKYVHT